jgi:hypothetical protein
VDLDTSWIVTKKNWRKLDGKTSWVSPAGLQQSPPQKPRFGRSEVIPFKRSGLLPRAEILGVKLRRPPEVFHAVVMIYLA